jgi:site-specific recombinase XerD
MKTKRSSRAGKIRGIYPRGNIFWFARMVDGCRTQVSLKTSDYAEAVVNATKIIDHPFLNDAQPLQQEIESFLNYKKRQNEYSSASVESKQYALSEFAHFVGKRVGDISTADVERFYQSLQKRVSESTAQGYITTIRSFFNRMVELKKIRFNPVNGVNLARLDQKGRLLFCPPDLRNKLIGSAPSDAMKFILYCGFHAGLRKNEIIEARPEWFDLERGSIHVRATDTFRPKDREARTIPLTREFQKFLKRYGLRWPFMLRPDVTHGEARYRYDFRRPWDNFMEEQGCSWVTPHVMRHTFASLFASNGVSIYKIALWLGDDVRVVQKHYAKLLPKDEDIESAFRRAPGPRSKINKQPNRKNR